MSKRRKLEKFAENLTLPNVFEQYQFSESGVYKDGESLVDYKGQWCKVHFNNDNPLHLELACGRGDYSLGLANLNPQINYLGIDIKGARIWKGAKAAMNKGLSNVAFLRTRIEWIPNFFAPLEVDEMWITFPDPFLKKSKSNKRLTSSFFLDQYSAILKNNALVHLKTDDDTLYQFSLESISSHPLYTLILHHDSVYEGGPDFPEIHIKTHYELMHLAKGKTIKYIRFRYNRPINL